jgi:hypothetical protein
LANDLGNSGGVFVPGPPILPDPEPPAVLVCYNYEQIKNYRLAGCHFIVRATYDDVQDMLEAGILKKHEHEYLEWLEWVEASR